MTVAAGVAASSLAPAQSAEINAAAAPVDDEVDPLAEAEVYIAYGRDARPKRFSRKRLPGIPIARMFSSSCLKSTLPARISRVQRRRRFPQTHRGQGGNWLKVAAMGYALDPGNRL